MDTDTAKNFPQVMGAYAIIGERCASLLKQNDELANSNSQFLKKIKELEDKNLRLRMKITLLETPGQP